MIHLTHTGQYAGITFCGEERKASGEYTHVSKALNNQAFRDKVCPVCLKVYATEAYDDDEDMPQWVKDIRE